MKTFTIVLAFIISILYQAAPAQAQQQVSGYHIIDTLVLGGEGGWDYLTVDTSAERLYVSRGTRVLVVDVIKNSIVGEIPHTTGVHGIAFETSASKGYTSNGRDSSVTVFDLKTLKTIRTVKIDARNPDAIIYDPFTRRVFTFNGGSMNATAIDVQTDSVVGTITLPGKPEFAVSDKKGRMFVNIEDKSEIVAFDPQTLKIIATWQLTPGTEPSGLAMDIDNHRLFSVCSNRMMVILNSDSGTIVTTLPIGENVDGAAFDPAQHLAFSSNGDGTLTIVRENTPQDFSVVENIPTRRGARTLTIDEKTHHIYTVTARFGPPPAPTTERPHPRPTIEPGSVTLYIIGK
jgi:DNA-binding beta-propeller fold protein YncE